MIREFSVENYLSIRDRQTLSFISKGPESEVAVEVSKGIFINKLGILYGANASGKSNMLIALNEVFRILITPKSEATARISGCIPFIPTQELPVKMEVSFYADAVRYDYSVEFSHDFILKETLKYYPKGSKSLFYERFFEAENTQAKIMFGDSLRLTNKTKDAIRENTLNNHSVLSVCVKNSFREDIAPFSSLHEWISSHHHEIDGDFNRKITDILKDAYGHPKKRKFFDLMLAKADLNITSYRPVIEERIIPREVADSIKNEDLPEKLKDSLLDPIKETIMFSNHSDEGSFDVPLRLQSKGTQKYIKALGVLFDLVTDNHVYYLDELGEDLHSDLMLYYLEVFLYNSERSQLIITSQETALLQQDIINENRSLVWFVDKNRDTASSEYSRGDSFGLHKNLSLYKSYRIGRLGAKPELGSIFVDLDD